MIMYLSDILCYLFSRQHAVERMLIIMLCVLLSHVCIVVGTEQKEEKKAKKQKETWKWGLRRSEEGRKKQKRQRASKKKKRGIKLLVEKKQLPKVKRMCQRVRRSIMNSWWEIKCIPTLDYKVVLTSCMTLRTPAGWIVQTLSLGTPDHYWYCLHT